MSHWTEPASGTTALGEQSVEPRTRGTLSRELILRAAVGRHLLWELIVYSFVHRQWWLLPVIWLILLASVVAVIGQAVVPYTLYTLF